MDDLVIARNDTLENCMYILDEILLSLKEYGIQFNIVKFKLTSDFVIYLGFVVMQEVINSNI